MELFIVAAGKMSREITARTIWEVYHTQLKRSRRRVDYAMQVLRTVLRWHGITIPDNPLSQTTAGRDRIVIAADMDAAGIADAYFEVQASGRAHEARAYAAWGRSISSTPHYAVAGLSSLVAARGWTPKALQAWIDNPSEYRTTLSRDAMCQRSVSLASSFRTDDSCTWWKSEVL